jgi:hypothetical protein
MIFFEKSFAFVIEQRDFEGLQAVDPSLFFSNC